MNEISKKKQLTLKVLQQPITVWKVLTESCEGPFHRGYYYKKGENRVPWDYREDPRLWLTFFWTKEDARNVASEKEKVVRMVLPAGAQALSRKGVFGLEIKADRVIWE